MEMITPMAPRKIALLTDSTADLTTQVAEENHIHVVPLRIRCADGEYSDGVDIHAADIYARLRAGELPKTSLPAGTSRRPLTASGTRAMTASSPSCSLGASPAPII